jgi:hypothetical protein
MMYPLVRELAVDGVPVAVTCRVLKIARQPYYRWLKCPVTDAELDEAYLANAIFDAHRDDPEFGYRFLADEVRAGGHAACDRTVWRHCADNGWWSVFGKPKNRKAGKPGTPSHDDLVRRVFTADRPNELWLTDLTEHRTDEGKLYLCAIKDVYSNRIVGYSIDDRMKARLAVAALDNAVARRGDVAGCILHSDRGSQGEISRSSQHLDMEVTDGTAARLDGDADRASGDAFARQASDSTRRRAGVLGEDRRGPHERGGCDRVRGVGAGRIPLVSRAWWHAIDPAHASHGQVPVVR